MSRKRKRYVPFTKRRGRPRIYKRWFLIYLAICIAVILIGQLHLPDRKQPPAEDGTIREIDANEGAGQSKAGELSYEDIPEYSGSPYCTVNGNAPSFTERETELLSSAGYEYYSALDNLGRCGYCEACVGQETMPEDEERGEIWTVHPSGWRSNQGWERCHLIAWSLTGENANDHNLVTGTHYMNVDGMLPFEIQVAEAADKGKHIMYRVTPVYNGIELIPRGVHMQAQTVEDNSVSFNVFVYNVEPGRTIDYIAGYVM